MDKVIELIHSQLIIDRPALYILIMLFVLFLIQVYFYLSYYRKPVAYFNKENKSISNLENLSVSIIIIAKNESENLEKNLPLILEQDYPNFEVVVVNDGSTDESQDYLELFSKTENRLYSTFLPLSEDKDVDRRRILCMTLGIKAAKNEILLFTDAGACPLSNQWISSMVQDLANNKNDIALGYSLLKAPKSFWGRIARFDNLLFTLQYFSKAIKMKPFIGTYNNIAYRKSLFFENKGFSKTLNYEYAEEVFLNQIITSQKTTVVLNKESFVTIDLENFSHWKTIKKVYCKSKKYFRGNTTNNFILESASRYLIYLVAVLAIIYTLFYKLWAYLIVAILMLLIRNLVQLLVLKKASKHFQSKPFYFSLPLIDLLQPIYNSMFRFSKNKIRR